MQSWYKYKDKALHWEKKSQFSKVSKLSLPRRLGKNELQWCALRHNIIQLLRFADLLGPFLACI